MRAVRNDGSGPAVVEVDEPGGDGVLLEVAASSICGTDLALMAMGAEGFTYGHEFAGTVDGVAYAVEPLIACGQCAQCAAGATNRCTGGRVNLGIFVDGGLSDRVRVPEGCLVPLPEGLPLASACLVEPAAVAWHGVRLAALEPGQRVAVVGGGSIGLLAAAWARSLGADVDVAARHDHQAERAERLGAGRPDGEYDVVIDAAGSQSGLARCADLARPGATVVLLGVYYDTAPLAGTASLVKELTYTAAMAYGRHDGTREVDEAAALLAGHPEVADALITHRLPLDAAAEAFRLAGDRRAGVVKVVVEPG